MNQTKQWLPFLLLLAFGCQKQSSVPSEFERARPVEVISLGKSNPENQAALSGVVEPYGQQQVGFEVGGRLGYVIDDGSDVEGEILNEMGKVLQKGDVIARLDAQRFENQVQLIKRQIAARKQSIKALQIDLDLVATSQLSQAKANLAAGDRQIKVAEEGVKEGLARLSLADSELKRQKTLFAKNSATQASLDQATSNYNASKATVERLQATFEAAKQSRNSLVALVKSATASIELRKARIIEAGAELKAVEQQLAIANEDLQDCILRAPFTGRITKILKNKGAFVQPGEPVLEVTVFDPIKVGLEVSAATDRQISQDQRALISPRDAPEKVIVGHVFAKGLVANPDTRTFKIDFMVRNRREDLANVSDELLNAPRIRDIVRIDERYIGRNGPMFIEVKCIFQENGKSYAYKLPQGSIERTEKSQQLIKPEKIELKFEGEYATIVNWSFRRLDKSVNLKRGDQVIRFPKPEHANGVVFERRNWIFRPGDVVSVGFNKEPYKSGFYVPVNAIANINNKQSVMIVDGQNKAKRIAVKVFESVENKRRIEAPELKENMKLIVRGLHYVEEGQTVNIVSTLQNKRL